MIASRLAMVTVVVPDYDEGLAFFAGKLGFAVLEDTPLGECKRWVVVSPGNGTHLLLARAANDDQVAAIGHQTGGRVGFFLHTEDIARSARLLEAAGVAIERPLRRETYGAVLVFRDPFGNLWDLIEPAATATSEKAA
ncbi:MAG: VOC family protein [Novosphingobium sp.]|jgi:catechol 2,3-dioxygenase-like lactoylglutathione lyase family enzyme|uniref:VOC family protein n=1 Tax=Novosphingobium sp. TaxID=1874826 RepID=UPI00301904E7